MPAETAVEFRAASGIFAFCSLLALVLGYQLPTLGAFSATQSEIEFLTDADHSVRELVATRDENGDQWLSFLSQPISPNLESSSLDLLWRNTEGTQTQLSLATGHAIGPATLTDLPGGGVFVVWEARRDPQLEGQRVLRGRPAFIKLAANGSHEIELGAVEDIPTQSSNPLQPHLARLADDSLGLVWQARLGTYFQAVFSQRGLNGAWSKPQLITTLDSGDFWRPRIAAANDGRVLVAYEHFDPSGKLGFDVWLAIADHPGAPFQQTLVAGGPTYQGWPELAIDSQGRAWIAYEEARSFGQGGPLRSFRRTNLAMVNPEGVLFHATLPAFMQEEVRGDLPQLHVSKQGLSLTRRIPRNDYQPRNANMQAFYATWGTSHIRFDQEGTGHEHILPNTDGGNENDAAMLSGAKGLELFFTTDTRSQSFAQRFAFDSALENHWRLAMTKLEQPGGFPKVEPGPAPALTQPWGRGPRTVELQQSLPTVLYGDLHRHTDLSRCAGRKDGTLLDAVRYALGPGKLSFMAITDHFQHLTPWSFWRQMRDLERWDLPGRCALLPGVERMVTDLGHQNLVFASFADARAAGRNRLPEDLKVGTVVAIPHMTSLPKNPFDWKRWNADVQRLVEVHQGRRGSFEGMPVESANAPGQDSKIGEAPQAKQPGEATWPHAAFPAQAKIGWLTHLPAAIEANELPPGVISSSDHASSGTGFAGIMWREKQTNTISRDSIFQALLERQTFATTGPNLQLSQPHYVEVQIEADAEGERQLLVQADARQIASVTIFENGSVLAVEDQPAEPELVGKFLLRTHFGRGFAWELAIQAEGLQLTKATLRQPRPDLFLPPVVEKDGSVLLRFPAEVSYAADVDLVLHALPLEQGSQALRVEYVASGLGEAPRVRRVNLSNLESNFARRFWLQKRGKAPYFEVIALGTGLGFEKPATAEYELRLPLTDRPAGAIYYARVAWLDGNYAWSRLIR